MITLIITVLILAALGIIVFIVIRKFPQLSAMNIEESPGAKLKRLKQNIVAMRMMRKAHELQHKVITPENWARVKYLLSGSYKKLKLLEEKYKAHTAEAKIQLLLKRGRVALSDDLELAEQCFLDVITLDPKHLESYEALLHIYLSKKSLPEAIELLEFLVKLNPALAGRYLFDVAGALLENGDRKGAWHYAAQALTFEPQSPKYLDFLIELAILEKRRREGEKYLETLSEVNSENAKLDDFEKRLQEL